MLSVPRICSSTTCSDKVSLTVCFNVIRRLRCLGYQHTIVPINVTNSAGATFVVGLSGALTPNG